MPYFPPATASSGIPATTVTAENLAAAVASAVGTSTNYAREDHNHGTQSLALSQNVLTGNYTIPATTTAYVVDSLEIANGISLEIANTAALEIG